jgi:serine/threonine protein kinase/TolB-like protein
MAGACLHVSSPEFVAHCSFFIVHFLYRSKVVAVTTGSQLGVYTILDSLGAGGMGEVYRARDGRLEREVAIKLLHEDVTEDPERLARFEREAKLLASINHPNIATVYSLEEQEGVRFLVMELVPGETLADQLSCGPLAMAAALTIGRQIADALEAAHEQGVVHRDLKPANIKITPRGRVKVLDFGLAKNVGPAASLLSRPPSKVGDDATPAGVLLGTPAYMSPEQARGQPVDRRADIWAFGCVLFEALAGRKPFDGPTLTDILVAVLEREPDWGSLPAEVPARTRDLLERCLRKDPTRRLRDIGDARIELEEAGDSGEAPITTPNLAPTVARQVSAIPLSQASTMPPSSSAPTLAVASPPRLSKAWKIGLAAGVTGFLLVGTGLGLWLAGVFSPRENPPPSSPGDIRMEIGFDGFKVDGLPLGPDNKAGRVRFGFPDLMGGFMGKGNLKGNGLQPSADSLAVLPFFPGPTPGEQELGKLAERLASRINSLLAATPGLKVKAHAEAVRQKALADKPRLAGTLLQVNKILVISAVGQNQRQAVTADLVQASDGTPLWRESFEDWRTEEELAQRIADKVRQKVGLVK